MNLNLKHGKDLTMIVPKKKKLVMILKNRTGRGTFIMNISVKEKIVKVHKIMTFSSMKNRS